jgi:hypothetical protein
LAIFAYLKFGIEFPEHGELKEFGKFAGGVWRILEILRGSANFKPRFRFENQQKSVPK